MTAQSKPSRPDAEQILRCAPDGMAVVDSRSVILFANPAAESMLGAECVGGKLPWQVQPGKTRQLCLPGPRKTQTHFDVCAVPFTWKGRKAYLLSLHKDRTGPREEAVEGLKYALASEKVLLGELEQKNKLLTELSITDALTGLHNRRSIMERLHFEFLRAKRYGTPLACIIMDIDHFKSINDTYGHQCGDRVLEEIGRIIRKVSREVDICGRYGGEEFLVVASLNLPQALQFAARLHAGIGSQLFSLGKRKSHVTVSIGVADCRKELRTEHQLVERADKMLYRAKREGRNTVRAWERPGPRPEQTLDQASISNMAQRFVKLSNDARAVYMESTTALLTAINAKDHYTHIHSQNVSRLGMKLARALGLPEAEVEAIRYAGLLHDVGKIGIPKKLLVKKTPLTQRELEVLKTHPVISAEILRDIRFLEKELPVVLHHHERCDGNGYPHGLKDNQIPRGAKILAVVDAFDAMTTDRDYRPKFSTAQALEEIRRCRGTQFDRKTTDAFCRMIEKAGV